MIILSPEQWNAWLTIVKQCGDNNLTAWGRHRRINVGSDIRRDAISAVDQLLHDLLEATNESEGK